MKKHLLLILAILFAASCNTSKLSTSGENEKKFISNFLTYMDKGSGPDYQGMMNCISPEYIREHGIDVTGYKVDNYTVWGFSIESYSTDGLIVTKIWGKDREWVHELTFKLRKEKGKLYIVPSEFADQYISPWWTRKTYIRE